MGVTLDEVREALKIAGIREVSLGDLINMPIDEETKEVMDRHAEEILTGMENDFIEFMTKRAI